MAGTLGMESSRVQLQGVQLKVQSKKKSNMKEETSYE